MNTDTVELHFIDGPLAGTRKMEHKDTISRNRTYRYLEPTQMKPEVIVPTNTVLSHVSVICLEWHYLPFSLPSGYNKTPRFAMLLERGLN